MIAIIGKNNLEKPEDISAAILPNGKVLVNTEVLGERSEGEREGLEGVLKNYRESANRAGDETVSNSSIMEKFAMRSNNGYAKHSNVWLFEDGGFEGYKPISEARELIKEAGLH